MITETGVFGFVAAPEDYNWNLFGLIEGSLMQFSDYVNVVNQDAYSRQIALRLYDMGVLVEGMMKGIISNNSLDNYPGIAKELSEARRVSGPSPDMRDYAEVLEKVFHLSRGKVRFGLFSYEDICQPRSFSDSNHRSPDW